MKPTLDVLDLGLIEYQPAWELQNRLAAEIAAGQRPATLLLLEHPHTYTFGRRGQAENLLWDENELKKRGASVHWVDRGGDVTYHGPGQLVGYPLLPLGRVDANGRLDEADYVGYVRRLEKCLVSVLAHLGLVSGQIPGLTGVWVQADVHSRCKNCKPADRKKPAKIAAIGVKVDARGVSRHGFALNVAPEMEYFEGIVPCGISEYPVTSLEDLLPESPQMQAVKQLAWQAFCETFNMQANLQTRV